ncbi:MAG: PDZ domain-containing protein [Bacteroidales bacterium]|nr:PDZ domain-containing protein [Bacteroidales bacterium]
MRNFKKIFFAAILVAGSALFANGASAANQSEARLLRFPDIKGDKIVFSYAGDLYITSSNGGVSRRLTSSIGYEMFPKFSPDGKMVAFTGQYDGNTEVYVIPAEGGEPKRVTYTPTLGRDDIGDRMGPNNIVMDWTPDGKKILYRTRSYTFNDFTGQLMMVPVDGGLSERVPLKNGGFANFSPDGKELAYNYIFREFRSWKRYEGGMADDIRIFNFQTKESKKITDNVNQDVFPMWSPDGAKVFYASDRDSYMNIYEYDVKTEATKQITNYKEYDVKFPSSGDNYIVYENGGYIHKLDMNTGKWEKINVSINNDIAWSRPEWKDLSGSLRSISISPNGERLLGVARGDLFSIPAKNGITYNLTNSSDANDKIADWSPDGNGYAYVSDKDGEFNIWYVDSKGKDKRITNVKTHILGFEWSPDAKKIAWSEKMNTLNILDVASGKNTVVEKSELSPMNDYSWSPDSKYLVFTRPGKDVNFIVVYNTLTGDKQQVTDEWYNSSGGNFSKDGKYLLFSSARTFSPTYGQTEWNHVYTNMNKVYILPLAIDADIPFAPQNDTVALANVKTSADQKKPEAPAKTDIQYDFTNIKSRIIELPVTAGYYGNIHMIGNNVYYSTRGGMKMYDIDKKKEIELKANLIFSAGYKKALAISGRNMQVVDIPKAAVTVTSPISLKGVKKLVDYRKEWMQIYNESWRQMRDYFYAKNMHGVDWNMVQKRYSQLVPHINHRSDLAYVIGEMIGELNVGHAYSQNGEHPEAPRVQMGLLGAEFSRDKSGFFKIEKIIEGANWSKETRSPLSMPGLGVKEGDFIISINGRSLKETNDIFEYLAGTANSIIEIEVNTKADATGARKILVEPIADESGLRYFSWVQNNIKKVSEATNGEVGYIHIPDMGVPGLNEFVKHYYPQLSKKALIIDDRGNGGGNVSPMITERLQRTITYFSMHTNQKEGSVNPVGTFQGPKVLLVNEYSASDGDLFPYRFKHNKLGKVIGRRTWGGVVGYSGSVPVVDGGSIVTPSYAPFAADGSGWIIEGTGVAPDIDIFNDPYKEFMGEDTQLNKALEVIKQQMKEHKYLPATIPPFPNKAPKK